MNIDELWIMFSFNIIFINVRQCYSKIRISRIFGHQPGLSDSSATQKTSSLFDKAVPRWTQRSFFRDVYHENTIW